MFLIDMQFTAPLAKIDGWVQAHRDYLASHYQTGTLLFGGRKVPRTGGIVICTLSTVEQVDALLSDDPLIKQNLAHYRLTEFVPAMSSANMAEILGLALQA